MSPSKSDSKSRSNATTKSWWYYSFLPFRKAVIRGLAIVTPPLLTIVLFLWAWNIIDSYVLRPVEAISKQSIVWAISDARDDAQVMQEIKISSRNNAGIDYTTDPPSYLAEDGTQLVKINQKWIPKTVFLLVAANPGEPRPDTASAYYHRYVRLEYLPRHLVIPAFLSVFVLAMYFLGRLFTFGIGRWLWAYVESLIGRVPIVSNVYSSVKQVTDFAFSENEIQFTRVVAVEYPSKGIWTIGFVTGESMLDIRTAANEPMVSVLMPTSPMPATGFVISIAKSQTIDLNLTMDQAIQWCVSCGVVVPAHQQMTPTSASATPPSISLPPTAEADPGSAAEASEAFQDPPPPPADPQA